MPAALCRWVSGDEKELRKSGCCRNRISFLTALFPRLGCWVSSSFQLHSSLGLLTHTNVYVASCPLTVLGQSVNPPLSFLPFFPGQYQIGPLSPHFPLFPRRLTHPFIFISLFPELPLGSIPSRSLILFSALANMLYNLLTNF